LKTAELEPLPGEPVEAGENLRSPSHITVQLSTPELQSNEINLIGCSVEEALGRADKFLDQAYLASVPSVRLIHGFGMGVLRKAISKWLSAQPYVSDFHAASPGEGGNAVTVVSLKN
jgi:DNA mismatch repair protein MutS2